jgi:hypothetical protein
LAMYPKDRQESIQPLRFGMLKLSWLTLYHPDAWPG